MTPYQVLTNVTPFPLWSAYTPTLPAVYWDVDSQEERIKKICLVIHKLTEYADYLCGNVNVDKEAIEELQADFAKFQESGFEDYYEQLLYEWLNANMAQIFSMYAKLVVFGLDADGHFAAWIPESWSEIYFSMVADYSDILYGRLVLLYDAEGNFDYQYGAPAEVGNYENLSFKPAIEGHVLMGNQTFEQLGLVPMTEQEIEDA